MWNQSCVELIRAEAGEARTNKSHKPKVGFIKIGKLRGILDGRRRMGKGGLVLANQTDSKVINLY